MSKGFFIKVTCGTCRKERLANKWCFGADCKKCATIKSGAKRRGRPITNRVDLAGKTLRNLRVISLEKVTTHGLKWLCLCKCGKSLLVTSARLLSGKQKSCGCHKITQNGFSKTKTYKSWACMLDRCYRERLPHYKRYGGRGIKVCERWKDSFLNFLEDMGERPEGRTLDRIDYNGDYSKENCRWATNVEQAINRRTTKLIYAFGKAKRSKEWCAEFGVKCSTLEWRIKKGMSPEEAITKKSMSSIKESNEKET